MPIGPKPCRMVTYNKELPSIKSQDLLIIFSSEVIWEINKSYLHYHNDYGHQTWQRGYIQSGRSFH